jgi:putative membrane protein
METMSVLLVISGVCAVLAGLVHVYIFFLESVAWTSPRVRRIFGLASESEALATRSLAFNQGFYNLFLAIGAILGVVLVLAGNGATGWTLVVFSTASMLGAAVVLAGTGRRYLNSAFVQGSLPLITLLFAFIGSTFSAA